MDIEYEVRILEINLEEFEQKLLQLGAELSDCYQQKRYVYDMIPKQEGKWIRLRTNGVQTTLTIKSIESSNIDGTKELEIEVSNFHKCHLILQELGYKAKGYQENKRKKYLLDGVEIDIDSWPLIPTYVEIEGRTKEEVEKIVEKLGYFMDDVTTMDVNRIYTHYGYSLEDIPILKFEEEK